MPKEKSAGAIIYMIQPVKSAEGGVPQDAEQFDRVKVDEESANKNEEESEGENGKKEIEDGKVEETEKV